jgi:hypothetical protein
VARNLRQMEVRLNKLTDQLRQSREENEFFETDLNQWEEELTVMVLLIGLLVIAQMIYIAYQVNRTKIFLDDSIKEIYPKEISIHLERLLNQFKQLD